MLPQTRQFISHVLKPFRLILLFFLAAACHSSDRHINLQQATQVDNINRIAFENRYDAPDTTIKLSREVLRFIADSIPEYHDGRLRAWNNLAKAYYIVSMPDSSSVYADSVLHCSAKSNNREIEQLIAKLTHARLKQRNCDIAGSYRMLYDVAQSDILDKQRDDFLYNYAKSEYYATLLSLNYSYRKGMQKDVQSLLNEAEHMAPNLKCDHAQDMVMNYSLAFGHLTLCSEQARQSENLRKSLEYIQANLDLLLDSNRFSLLHFANTVQLTAAISANSHIEQKTWLDCKPLFDSVCNRIGQQGIDLFRDSSLAMSLYIESSYMFEDYGDPYHTLGALVATGNLCLQRGDTAAAQTWFLEAYDRILQNHITAPKYESQLYDGLLKSHAAISPNEATIWAKNYISIREYITQNQEADFILQTQLANAKRKIDDYRIFSIIIVILSIVLVILAIMLAFRTRVLRTEKRHLQLSREKDVERIANVETCLSVMRHDINPFISYLQNRNLPPALHQEILSQLLRTFENIKSWTNLSIPSGLAFNPTECDVDEIFADAMAMNTARDGVSVTANRNGLKLYGDRLLLIIMIRNLLANAMQHTSEGKIQLISNIYSEDDRFVKLTVSDTGCGMSADEVDNLFRTDKKPDQQAQHSGFGLILCRYIVKKHDDNTIRGCRIWAESIPAPTEGHGTKINICLQRFSNL